MTARVTVRLYRGKLEGLLTDSNQVVGKSMDDKAKKVIAEIQRTAPRRTGRLANSFSHKLARRGGEITAVITSSTDYWVYVEKGTGIYAGRGFITPKRAKFLSWQEGSKRIFARKVRGQKANPFVENALRAAAD